jgi:hypothetical protein
MESETRLEMAQRHVSEGRTLVERHRAFIAKLRAAGRPTHKAEALLDACERSLRIFEDDLAALLRKNSTLS